MALAEQQRQIDYVEEGWYPDPEGNHYLRYFNGAAWTGHVTHHGPTPCLGCFVHSAE